VYVACSTLCFARHPLEIALRTIAELEFHKFELAIHEGGPHLKPSQVAADVSVAASRLRIGPGLVPSAFSVEIEAANDEDYRKQFKAVCRLARMSAVPLVSLAAAARATPLDTEVTRLQRLTGLADKEGVLLNVETRNGTLTEDPDQALALCQAVPGLGLTYDPSHYLTGPHKSRSHDHIFPYVRHVHLRDTGRKPDQFQVRVGQGQVEYGRIINQLSRHRYDRVLSVDIRDQPDVPFNMTPEVRKLKYLLESLV
jgi:sugar phosphate isomerase/epimerase